MTSENVGADPSQSDLQARQMAEARQNLRRKLRSLTWEWSEVSRLADALNQDLDNLAGDIREQRQR